MKLTPDILQAPDYVIVMSIERFGNRQTFHYRLITFYGDQKVEIERETFALEAAICERLVRSMHDWAEVESRVKIMWRRVDLEFALEATV